MEIEPKREPSGNVLGQRAGRAASLCMAVAGAFFAVCGCSEPPTFEFDALDVSQGQSAFSELSLGRYEIPVPLPKSRSDDSAEWSNRLRLDFDLYALVEPGQASTIEENWKRHEGTIRDQVIRVCRSATIDELQEPELATLKARLMDAVQVQLGQREVRRLMMTEIVSREL
jgi:hypothetical protein